MTHKELVEKANMWLKNRINCKVILKEFKAYVFTGEIPDVIGWVYSKSILVEVKATRGDFLSDCKKKARKEGMPALGDFRFYFTNPGVVKKNEIPDKWGLYELHGLRILHKGGQVYYNAGKPPFESHKKSEVALLLAAMRGLQNGRANSKKCTLNFEGVEE
jgi:hypothetical protein